MLPAQMKKLKGTLENLYKRSGDHAAAAVSGSEALAVHDVARNSLNGQVAKIRAEWSVFPFVPSHWQP